MLTDLLLVAAGIAVLAFAGDRLVDYAAALAEHFRVTPAVVGLTIVAAGTSMPELFVSAAAALEGSPAIALGNVVGSNVANIGLVLGSCALLAAVPLPRKVLRFEYPFMALTSFVALLLCRDGVLDRLEGGFFVAGLAGFTAYAIGAARREMEGAEALVPEEAERLKARPAWVLALGVAGGLAGLGVGAQLLVTGAVHVAHALGISERVVGLTVVAVGTSLPELVASLAAVAKKQHEMAVANVLGSNIFNILLILGVTGLIRPIPVEAQAISLDLWVMMGMTALLLPLVAWDHSLSRRDGVVLLGCYLAYVVFLLK